MRIPNELKVAAAITLTIFVFLVLLYIGPDLGLDSDIATRFTQVLPGLALFAVGALILASTGPSMFALPGFSVLGIGTALLFEYMYNANMISSQLMSGLSVGDIQILIIIFAFLIGAAVAAIGGQK